MLYHTMGWMDLRAVAFDIDGTLYPNSTMYLRSGWSALRRIRFLHHFSRIRRQIRTIRPIEDFRVVEADLLADSMGVSPERARQLIDGWVGGEWNRAFRGLRPFPHVAEFLSELRTQGLKLGVLSDMPVGRKLVELGLDGWWDCVLSAQDTGYLKPNPEPFLEIAHCLGAAPRQTLYVGNNYNYDIIGAADVGMVTAHIAPRPVRNTIADFTFKDYAQLKEDLLNVVRSV